MVNRMAVIAAIHTAKMMNMSKHEHEDNSAIISESVHFLVIGGVMCFLTIALFIMYYCWRRGFKNQPYTPYAIESRQTDIFTLDSQQYYENGANMATDDPTTMGVYLPPSTPGPPPAYDSLSPPYEAKEYLAQLQVSPPIQKIVPCNFSPSRRPIGPADPKSEESPRKRRDADPPTYEAALALGASGYV